MVMRRLALRAGQAVVIAVWCAGPPPLARAERREPPSVVVEVGGAELPAPPSLRPNIEFWKRIFGEYSEHQAVIHDAEDLRLVYAVLDFRPLLDTGLSPGELARVEAETTESEKERIREALGRMRGSGGGLEASSEADRQILDRLRGAGDLEAALRAADPERVRAQRGVRERFAAGVVASRRYLPEIEGIFREEGVPVPITRLALVESCFNVHAYSKVGAAGVWQFMPATGRLFMRVDDIVDERRDPIISGRAAARYLRANYEKLGTWPLAISAYNHGPEGIARAVASLGTTDIGDIVQRHRAPSFRFASRNFYAEFLAALEVDSRHRDYFGELELARPVPAEHVDFPHYVSIETAARLAGVGIDEMLELNPALSFRVRSRKAYVPRRYALNVPAGSAARARRRYAALPDGEKFDAQRKLYVVHKVAKGQTLSHIARRYGTTVAVIKATNNLTSARVRAGQALKIPTG